MSFFPWLKISGAFLIFLAWGVSTFFYDQAREASVRFRSVNADVVALERYANSALDHQQTAQDLAVLTQLASAASADEGVAQLSTLALLQSFNAQSRTIRVLRHSADGLAELSRSISKPAVLGDSIVALAKNLAALERAHTALIDTLLTVTAPDRDVPAIFYITAQQQQEKYLSLQHERANELIHFYVWMAEEADAAAKKADTRARWWFFLATLLFASGTVLLLWHDLTEARRPKSTS